MCNVIRNSRSKTGTWFKRNNFSYRTNWCFISCCEQHRRAGFGLCTFGQLQRALCVVRPKFCVQCFTCVDVIKGENVWKIEKKICNKAEMKFLVRAAIVNYAAASIKRRKWEKEEGEEPCTTSNGSSSCDRCRLWQLCIGRSRANNEMQTRLPITAATTT